MKSFFIITLFILTELFQNKQNNLLEKNPCNNTRNNMTNNQHVVNFSLDFSLLNKNYISYFAYIN